MAARKRKRLSTGQSSGADDGDPPDHLKYPKLQHGDFIWLDVIMVACIGQLVMHQKDDISMRWHCHSLWCHSFIELYFGHSVSIFSSQDLSAAETQALPQSHNYTTLNFLQSYNYAHTYHSKLCPYLLL